MLHLEPITIVEIDIDYCTRAFGAGACTAQLGGSVSYKCFNTYATCAVRELFNKSVLTLRFIQPTSGMPIMGTVFPCLKSVSGSSSTVNIAGSDQKMESLGVRAKVTAEFTDFPYHDRFTDKYAQQRVSGVAQIDGIGYDPLDRGSFWGKFKARFPNYAGRPMRVIQGWLDGGVFTAETTRHYIMSDMKGPDANGSVSIEAKDILKLADDDRAVYPKDSVGRLAADIGEGTGTAPLYAGTGSGYPSSGFVVIGSEILAFTRSGDTMNFTARGVSGSAISSHKIDDGVQLTYSPRLQRIDDVIRVLLVSGASIPASFIPTAEWKAEIDRWLPTLRLTTDICKPTGVNKLIGELAILGISIWWDDTAQKINLRVNRPVDEDPIAALIDNATNISVVQSDDNDARLSRVAMYTVMLDPTQSETSATNYSRHHISIDVAAESENSYRDEKRREVFCRWLNHGNDSIVRILARRLLNRFRVQPVHYIIELDYDDDLALVDVVSLNTRVSEDPTGKSVNKLMQVIKREDVIAGHRVRVTTQSFQYDQRYGYITENTRPRYIPSTPAQRARGAYFANNTTLKMSNGDDAYRFI